jgi:hypothetical protein
MKKYIYHTMLSALLATGLTGCIDETVPADDTITADQAGDMTTAAAGFTNSIVGFFAKPNTVYSDEEFEMGYAGLGMIRDIYCEDFPIYSAKYDYFYYWEANRYLGSDYSTCVFPWYYYYQLIENTHSVLRLNESEEMKPYLGIGHFFRAWAYFDLARLYEYKKTGIASIDDSATQYGSYGLTVPIIRENTTEAEAKNTPRATYYDMYRFILDDLDKAEEYLKDYKRTAKNMPDLAVVYGEKARVYLDIATRFEKEPSSIAESASVDLGANTAQGMYALAAEYARKAITQSGATPLTQSEWFGGSSYTDGFNSVNASAWMLGTIVSKENLSSSEWRNFIGHVSPEQHFGVGGISYSDGTYTNMYGAQRLISSFLFRNIEDADWRKTTWIAPADAGQAPGTKYKTSVPDDHFKQIPAYASLKFRPKNGEASDYSTGAAADYPLMRVEEMYFIEAEALASSQGLSAGMKALESFINTYRYTDGSFYCSAYSLDEFRQQLMIQKRIEFWGEGLVFWDYKRLALHVSRDYTDSNFLSTYQLHSVDGYCAPWFNAYIPTSEYGRNAAIVPNPDTSGVDIP